MRGIKQINNYTLIKQIGAGSFGEVYEAIDSTTNKIYAVKSITAKKLSDEKISNNFKQEFTILQKLNHPNIIKLEAIKRTLNNYYLILEYCNGGTLYDYIMFHKKAKSRIPEKVTQFFVRQIIEGLFEMHKKEIIHRDIKLENILLHFENHEGRVSDYSTVNIFESKLKIADLGLSKELKEFDITSSICGSPMTMAPDIVQGFYHEKNKYDKKVDLWSLGAITYELLTGELPFYSPNTSTLFQEIMKGTYKFPSNNKFSLESISFINGLLQFYPDKRYNWTKIYSHPFIKNSTENFTFIDFGFISPEEKINNSKNCDKFMTSIFDSVVGREYQSKIKDESYLEIEERLFNFLDQVNSNNELSYEIIENNMLLESTEFENNLEDWEIVTSNPNSQEFEFSVSNIEIYSMIDGYIC